MKVRTREAMPEEWAQVQNNLGIVYCDRICGDKAENLEQAIACYQNALLLGTREEFPDFGRKLKGILPLLTASGIMAIR